MKYFQDSNTGQYWAFQDEIRVEDNQGVLSFYDTMGGKVDGLPDTLVTVDGPPVPPTPVPSQVTASQGGIALIHFGLMDAVQAVVNAPDTPAEHKWAWDRATTWERNSPSFNYFADRAGITEQQKDELFVFAGQVVP